MHMHQMSSIRNIRSKKSQGLGTAVKWLLLIILAAVLLYWFYTTFIQAKAATKLECAIPGEDRKGECKVSCTAGDVEFKGLGCPVVTGNSKVDKANANKKTCCINYGTDNTDPNLKNYGGNDNYNFEVKSIDIQNPGSKGCVRQADVHTYKCPKDATITVAIGVVNLGKYALQINASPVVYKNDLKINPQPIGTQAGNIPVNPDPSKPQTHTVLVDFKIDNQDQLHYLFKAAATCSNDACQSVKTSTSTGGIYRFADNVELNIYTN